MARSVLYSIVAITPLFFLFLPLKTTAFGPNVNQPSSFSSFQKLAQARTSLITGGDGDDPSPFTSPPLPQRSPLTLLEHVNLNVPNHDHILDFYLGILGMGLDPRTAGNVARGEGMVWPNCGASQFHLVYGEVAQVIPGSIGLWYDDLTGLKDRLGRYDGAATDGRPFDAYSIGTDDGTAAEHVRVVDRYGNVFYCRTRPAPSADDDDADPDDPVRAIRRPLLTRHDVRASPAYGNSDALLRYAVEDAATPTECRGLDYVEFDVPRGTAPAIAEFYACVFDAPADVHPTGDGGAVAVVGFGSIDSVTGRASQSLLFRETDRPVPPYDGHHIAVYVGEDAAGYERAFENCGKAGVVWVNPRFEDRVVDLEGARRERQFRFKDVLELEGGRRVLELEHEVRSVYHPNWPGAEVKE